MLAPAACSFATTLVVVAPAEGVGCTLVVVGRTALVVVTFGWGRDVVVVVGCALRVFVGIDVGIVVVVASAEGVGAALRVVVVTVVVVTVVVVTVVVGRTALVVVVFGWGRDVVVVAEIVVVLDRDVSGREFNVNTRTSNSSGLDHISRCELRIVNRRRAMVIED